METDNQFKALKWKMPSGGHGKFRFRIGGGRGHQAMCYVAIECVTLFLDKGV